MKELLPFDSELHEDLFELFIMRIMWGYMPFSLVAFEYARELNSFKATKELTGKEVCGE